MPANALRTLHRSFGKTLGKKTPEWLVQKYRHWTTDVYVVSFPKSGRTWLRTIMGTALQLQFGTREVDPTSVHHMWEFDRNIPRFVFTHDVNAHLTEAKRVSWAGERYRNKTTLLLVRDPCDTIVSLYFEMTKRVHAYDGSISDFIRQDKGGIASLVAFLNGWIRNFDKLEHGLLLTYEDLHARPVETVGAALRFAGVEGVEDEVIVRALELSSFEAMQRMERSGTVAHVRLRPGDPADPQSFKVRSGKIGGFREHLEPEDCEFLARYVGAQLDTRFPGYHRAAKTV